MSIPRVNDTAINLFVCIFVLCFPILLYKGL
uniref:Uncharacterized protein n=1 Tax=Anguilla anguilla TaxID=7936 RepID=A0A0E9PWY5_ANGAN